jgi:urea transport system substrate-binding protein
MNTSKRWALLLTILGLCLTLLSGCGGETAPPAGAAAPSGDGAAVSSGDVVTVGVLHSLSGTMAMAESPMVDAVKMAVDEINAQGGVLGRQISYIVEDGASDPATFAEKATKLLTSDGVATVFGCWTSASRKAV